MPEHLYIHVPFCAHKCAYCAFYSVTNADPVFRAAYPELLLRELELRKPRTSKLAPQTIYVGGGTPAMLGLDGWEKLLLGLSEQLDLSHLREWSVEMNPESSSAELLATLKAGGVNRLTFGIQSFDEQILQAVRRRCRSKDVFDAYGNARSLGFENIGLDLIAGLPGVTMEKWCKDISSALTLCPEHISVYTLSVEPGTPLAAQVGHRVRLPNEIEQMDMITIATERLKSAGYNRYEISNYALTGCECRHNSAVWQGSDYLGIGAGAFSRLGVCRFENLPDIESCSDALLNGSGIPVATERLSPFEDALQRTVFRLRMSTGINLKECLAEYPQLAERIKCWRGTFAQLEKRGIIQRKGKTWALTLRGCEVCDAVIREML
jgi:oxygen-independent coproporphyrinogen III oxidase